MAPRHVPRLAAKLHFVQQMSDGSVSEDTPIVLYHLRRALSDEMLRIQIEPTEELNSRSSVRRRRDHWKRQIRMAALVGGVFAFLISVVIFFGSLSQNLTSDFHSEWIFTRSGMHNGIFPGNFLFYVLNAAFAGFNSNWMDLRLSLVFVLAAAVGTKVWISTKYVLTENVWLVSESPNSVPLIAATIASGLCMFAVSLPGPNRYLGQIPANVWHNATTIVLVPLAVGLFWTSLLYLRTASTKYLWWSLWLGALNIAAKPSFVMCFVCVFPLAALLHFGWRKETWRAWALTIGVGVVLAAQYFYVYVAAPSGSRLGTSSGSSIAPFKVWDLFLSYRYGEPGLFIGNAHLITAVPIAIVRSYAFPLAALLLGGAAVRRNRAVQYALALAAVGLAEYAILAESGPAAANGNFTWAAIVTEYILFTALVAAIVSAWRSGGWSIRRGIIALVFLAQVFEGFIYLAHWFATGSFD